MVTGLVDAVSYLALGRVFVANMTGNVVFLGFAAVGYGDFSVLASLAAILAFLLGAVAGGRFASWLGAHRGKLLATAILIECLARWAFSLCLVLGNLSARAFRTIFADRGAPPLLWACRMQRPGGSQCPTLPPPY